MSQEAALPPGFELDSAAISTPTPQPDALSQHAQGGGGAQTGALPDGFEVEQPVGDAYAGPMGAAAAFSEGAVRGLTGPVGTWMAKKLGMPDEEPAKLQEAHPVASGLGEFTGLASGLMGNIGVGGLANTAAGLVPEAAEGASTLAKMGNSALKQAAEMTVIGGADETAKQLVDPNRSAETALSNIGLGAALGAGTGAFITGAVSPLWKATVGDKLSGALQTVALDSAKGLANAAENKQAPYLLKKALSTFGGVSEEDIDAYVQHHRDIQNIPEFDEIYGHALDHVGDISDRIESGKLSVSEAKSEYKTLQQSFEQTLKESGADATTASRLAKQALSDGQAKLSSDILQQAVGAGDKAAAASEALRQKIVNASADSYDLLEQSSKNIPLKGFYSKAEDVAKELEAEGTLEAQAQAARIRQYTAGIIEKHGVETSGPEAKQLIQGLDKVSNYDFNASNFDKGLSNSYKQLRYELDSTLKDAVPEYRKAMLPLAEDSKLLAKLKKYGTPEGASSRIKALKNVDAYKNEMPLLRQLEKVTGSKFVHEIEPYANNELRDKLLKSLPEYAESERLAQALEDIKHPRTKAMMQEMLANSEEAKALREAEQALAAAKADQASIKGITPATLQSKLVSVSRPGKSVVNEALLNKIPGLEGKSIPEMMNLLRIRDSFTKNATRGSKHVNLYGMLAGALGSVAGHGLPGMGIGSAAGAFVDNNGPSMVKKILDKYITMFGDTGGTPAATKTMLLKVLGHDGPVSAEGFKAGTDYINALKKGEAVISTAVRNVFESGSPVLHPSQLPSMADHVKIDKFIAQNEKNPDAPGAVANSKLGHYLPDHQAAMALAISSQAKYLQSLKPTEKKAAPLDRPLPPTPGEEARYNRAKDIAIQPSIVLKHIKDGTWLPTDFADLKILNPAIYQSMQSKIIGAIGESVHNEEPIPYKIRVGLSAFVGQPLDSSMAPQNIMAAQPKPSQAPPPQQNQQPKGRKSSNSLNKMGNSYKTPGQAAESDRANRD